MKKLKNKSGAAAAIMLLQHPFYSFSIDSELVNSAALLYGEAILRA